MMANENTVTISIEEYFDLRQKAEMNAFLMNELGRIQQLVIDIENRTVRCENIVEEMGKLWQMKNG